MEYSIDFPSERQSLELDNIQLRNILLITKEVVNNAVKYSQARNISIRGRISEDTIHFEITDDGIGMNSEKVKVRNGLKNIRLRALEIGGNISIESNPGAGTRCQFNVPLQVKTAIRNAKPISS
jgi:signal transduction histidine kinase